MPIISAPQKQARDVGVNTVQPPDKKMAQQWQNEYEKLEGY